MSALPKLSVSSAPPPSPPPSRQGQRAQVGQRINDRYRLTRMIGRGGMGVVYEAFDEQVERQVAIKLVRKDCLADKKFMSRFARELEITTRLRHPSTIRVFEHGYDQMGRPFMVMELLRGHSLADALDQGPIEEVQALEYALQIAESLSEAHEHGIFHRDLKPENIYIESVGVSTVIKVLDFGIAGSRFQDDRLTNAGEVFGTPQYMSPEQCNGASLDHRTDIYSLGCILFEMLEGHPPFRSETPMATMLKHVQSKVPRMMGTSREVARVVMLCLRKDRERRVQDCATLANMLQDTLRGISQSNTRPGGLVLMPSGSLPTVGAGITGPHRPATPQNFANDLQEKRTRRFIPLLAGAFVVAAGLLFFLDRDKKQMRRSASASSELLPTTAKIPSAPKHAGATPINYALLDSPTPGATASLDGQRPCKLPCRLEVPVGDGKPHVILIKKPGFVPETLRWQPQSVTEAPPTVPALRRK